MTLGASPPESDPGFARRFTLVILFYFSAHTAVRTLLGGAFEVDEAEMLLLAQDLHWGYGLQLPLYNWWQFLWFEIFGVNTFAVAGAKNVMRALTILVLFWGLARIYPVRLAAVGASALFLVPDFLWQGQRAGTHSTAMCLMMAVCLWALVRVVRTRRLRDHLWLGAALGLGAISKYNFLLYALPLLAAAAARREMRPAILSRRMGVAIGLALVIVAGPVLWLVRNADKPARSTDSLFDETAMLDLPGRLYGLVLYGQGLVVGLALVLIVAFALRGRTLVRAPAPWAGAPFAPVVWWAFLGATAVGAAGAALAGITNLETRWLLPQYLLAAPILAIWGVAASPRGARWMFRVAAVLGALALAGMADIRLRGAGSDSLRIAVLAERLEARLAAQGGGVPLVVSDYYYAGNLRLHRPGWHYAEAALPGDLAPGAGPILVVLGRQATGLDDVAWLAQLDGRYRVVDEGTLEIPYRFEAEAHRKVRYAVLARGPAP